MQIFQK